MAINIERWKSPHQGQMYAWLRSVVEHLSNYLFRFKTATEAEIDARAAARGGQWRRVAGQSVNNGTQTTVTWDTTDQDTDDFMDTGTGVITIPVGMAGLYGFSFTSTTANWDGASTRTFLILTSTATGFPSAGFYYETLGVAAADGRGSVSGVWLFAEGDEFRANVFQLSGGAQNFSGGALSFWRISEDV